MAKSKIQKEEEKQERLEQKKADQDFNDLIRRAIEKDALVEIIETKIKKDDQRKDEGANLGEGIQAPGL